MRPFTHTIPLAEALALMRRAARPIGRTARVPLGEAAWRVLAQEVSARRDVPPFDRAAMDGYAVRASDTSLAAASAPACLELVGVLYSGEIWPGSVGPGQCVEIATGAPVPDGADAVVMVERTRRDGSRVTVFEAAVPGRHVVPRGHDMHAGDVVLTPGAHLTPGRLGVAAAVGVTELQVYERPHVAIASTGNELVDPGTMVGPGQVFDINRTTLAPLVRAHGGVPVPLPPVADTVDELGRALDAASDSDLIVVSGGSSVGERDLLVDAVRARGEMLFHGIAVKPGKPTLLARLGEQLLLGLPGNPTSCLSNAYLLLIPLLRWTARLPPHRPEVRRVALARTIVSASDRHQFITVRLDGSRAWPVFKGSGEISSMSDADGYLEIPAGVERIEEGADVEVTLF
jgi:molybdenum cofactor synthesis domain-containing protein